MERKLNRSSWAYLEKNGNVTLLHVKKGVIREEALQTGPVAAEEALRAQENDADLKHLTLNHAVVPTLLLTAVGVAAGHVEGSGRNKLVRGAVGLAATGVIFAGSRYFKDKVGQIVNKRMAIEELTT